jgi:hypothetical protein
MLCRVRSTSSTGGAQSRSRTLWVSSTARCSNVAIPPAVTFAWVNNVSSTIIVSASSASCWGKVATNRARCELGAPPSRVQLLFSVLAVVGFLSILGAFSAGDRFVAGQDAALDLMSSAWAVAMVSYSVGWHVGRRRQRAALKTADNPDPAPSSPTLQ